MPMRAEDLCVTSRRRGGRLRSASPTVSASPSATSSGRRCRLGRPWRLRRPQDRHALTTAMRRCAAGSRTLPSGATAERTHPARSPQPAPCPRPSAGQDAPAGPTALCRRSRRRPRNLAEPIGVRRAGFRRDDVAPHVPKGARCCHPVPAAMPGVSWPSPADRRSPRPARSREDHDHTSERIQAARVPAIQRYRQGRALCRDVVAAGTAADR
jgi:hypothetical protein